MALLVDDKTAVRIGALSCAVFAAVVAVVIGWRGSSLADTLTIDVEFDHIGALTEGSDVQIASRVVGTVGSISLTHTGARATLVIESRYQTWIPSNAEVFITAKGLLGQPFLEIGPPARGAPPAATVTEGQTLRGLSPARIEIVILRSIENTKQFRALLTELSPAIHHFIDNLATLQVTAEEIGLDADKIDGLRQSGSALTGRGQQLVHTLSASGLSAEKIGALRARLTTLEAAANLELTRISSDLESIHRDILRWRSASSAQMLLKLQLAASRALSLWGEAKQTVLLLTELVDRVDRGQGTVGAILSDPEFIDDAKELGRIIKRQPWRLIGTNRERRDLLVP